MILELALLLAIQAVLALSLSLDKADLFRQSDQQDACGVSERYIAFLTLMTNRKLYQVLKWPTSQVQGIHYIHIRRMEPKES
jgi:hypothetical protein